MVRLKKKSKAKREEGKDWDRRREMGNKIGKERDMRRSEAEKEARGGWNVKRGRRETGWRRSRRARSVQVVADIPDQYFHRFSGGYRQVASSRPLSNPYPSPILWWRYLSLFPPFLILSRLVHSRCCRLRFAFFSLPLWSSRFTFLPLFFPMFSSSLFHSSHISVLSTLIPYSPYVFLYLFNTEMYVECIIV